MKDLTIDIPIVICAVCFHVMEITEWLRGVDTPVGNYVPHPNSSHKCNNCGTLWEPSSGVPGDCMSEAVGIMFFCDTPSQVCLLEVS